MKNQEKTSLQNPLKELQDIVKRFQRPISGKKITSVIRKVFLFRIPNGTDLFDGIVSSKDRIKKVSVSKLNSAIQEWIKKESYEEAEKCFNQVITQEKKYSKILEHFRFFI
jgi:hypothetical protein